MEETNDELEDDDQSEERDDFDNDRWQTEDTLSSRSLEVYNFRYFEHDIETSENRSTKLWSESDLKKSKTLN